MSHMTRTDRLVRLERMQQLLAEQLAEQNLRMRYVMELLKVTIAPKTSLLGADNKPVAQTVTAYEFYQLQGREQMMAKLVAEMKEHDEQARVEREAPETDPSIEGAEGDGPNTPLAFTARRDTH